MAKNDDTNHYMNTRSKSKADSKSNTEDDYKEIVSSKTVNKDGGKKINTEKKQGTPDDDDVKDFLNLLLLLQKFENKNLINFKYDENAEDDERYESSDESIIEDDSIIDENNAELLYLQKYEKELLYKKDDSVPFKHKILKSNLKDEIKINIIKNINHVSELDNCSSEYQKLSSWVQHLEKIPFDNYVNLPVSYSSSKSKICNFLNVLQTDLNKCIYGQTKAKESILQIITQIITNPQSKGSIIALKGPPGVGKTSLIKNGLSKALNLPFSFITLAGISDSSYFDGFSYTYEGSKYGKICEVIMKAGCMNPIIFMDELDKVSSTEKGDEINNLLVHLTDFTQNDSFEDKYFSGIQLDLSKAIFIFSLNDDTILNPILKDRLNIITLEEFKTEEKVRIALDYLIPELKENIGIKDNIKFTTSNIEYIILNYCSSEPGVRELKRCVETILRRINVLKYSKKIKLNYSLEKFKFPLEIQNTIIDELLQDRKRKESISHSMMYV
jgi:ATP-dependent Lon protease